MKPIGIASLVMRGLPALMVALSAGVASAEGINLSWNDCGTHGTEVAAFACNTNSGAHEAVVSFIPPAGISEFLGIEAEILVTTQIDLPDWWKHGNGFCRSNTGLTANTDFTADPSNCLDPWSGQAASGQVYNVGYGGPNHARLRLFAALPNGYQQPLDPASEYYGFRVRISHSKTTGSGSCAGCETPVQLTLNWVRIDQTYALGNNPVLTTTASRTVVYWQNMFGSLPEIDAVSPGAGPPASPVTITGERLLEVTSVRFHAQEATFTVISDTEIQTAVPAGARTGLVHVQGPNGIGSSSEPFVVAPEIASFSPGRAPVGYSVVLTGINFTATTDVTFNGTSATFSVDNDTRITAVVPAGATDGPIAVTNAGGTVVSDDEFDVGPLQIPGDGGINLSWDDCGTAGGEFKSFACNTNAGSAFVMVGSFGAPDNIDQLTGVTATLEVTTSEPSLPNWWRHGSGQCRGQTGLGVNADFTAGPFSCLDPWQGFAASGHAYDVEYGGPEHGRLRLLVAVPNDIGGPLVPDDQYYAFKVLLLRSKTTGTGNCTGCASSACVSLQQLQLMQHPDQGYDPVIITPGSRNYVYWQSSSGIPACPASEPPPPPASVPSFAGSEVSIDRAIADRDGRGVSFSLTFATAGDGRIEVFDSSGRRRASRSLLGLGTGRHDVQLSMPEPLASGMYFARVIQGPHFATRRFAVTR